MATHNHILNKELATIEDVLKYEDSENHSISQSSVYWHVKHSLLVINKILIALEKSDPGLYKSNFNFKRSLLFTLNKIPRGKGRAPKQVIPENEFSKDDIINGIEEAKQRLSRLNSIDKNAFFQHPFFGDLNKKQTIKFLKLHTNHHLKIIRDIVK